MSVSHSICEQNSCFLCHIANPSHSCPVDLAKVLTATGTTEEKRDGAILEYCEDKSRGGGIQMFRALGAWIRSKQNNGL